MTIMNDLKFDRTVSAAFTGHHKSVVVLLAF